MAAGEEKTGAEELDSGGVSRGRIQVRVGATPAGTVWISVRHGLRQETVSFSPEGGRHLGGLLLRLGTPQAPLTRAEIREFRADLAAVARGGAPSPLLVSAIRAIVREELDARQGSSRG